MSSPEQPKIIHTDRDVIIFTVTLSIICAVILSILASALKEPQEVAIELDRSQQMLIAAKIFTHSGYFTVQDEKGKIVPAKYVGDGALEASNERNYGSQKDILELYRKRIIPKLVDSQGKMTTFKEAGIDYDNYLKNYKKTGYYKEPQKLIYEILPNPIKGQEKNNEKPIGYIIPVNGYGLWDAIYGYLAIKNDGETVIGISWYDQKETPGLGANISEEPWQEYFPGKLIFQPSASGKVDLKTDPIGITVVKGKVNEVLGDSPKARAAVDGMPGATLTGNGVTDAYREVLAAYRPFFIKINEETTKGNKDKKDAP